MALTTQRPATAQHPTAQHQGLRGRPVPYAVGGLRSALPLVVAAVLGAAGTAWLALSTGRGQWYDELAMRMLAHSDTVGNGQLVRLLEQISVGSAGIALAIMIGVALFRGRIRVALAAGVLVAGANLTTQVLKNYVLDRPDLGLGTTNSLPSGHTTVAFSLVLAAVLVSPRALRPLVTLAGAAAGALTGLATIIAGWHRPSDVIAALLVTLAWAALVSGVLAGAPKDGRTGVGGGMFAALLGGGLAAVGVIIYGFGWSASADASRVIPFTAAAVSGVAAIGVGAYAQLVARTSN